MSPAVTYEPKMELSRILIYPIKSCRAWEPTSAEVTKYGFTYDRRFMLLKRKTDGTLENMHVASFPELVLFFPQIVFPEDSEDPKEAKIELTYVPPKGCGGKRKIDFPLVPDMSSLAKIEVNMHKSPTKAYDMGIGFSDWLTSCLGYDVVLAYLGDGLRSVLSTSPNNPKPMSADQRSGGWLSGITSRLPASIGGLLQAEKDKITFADCAPFLVVSETSLKDVSRRLPDGEEMDITKFRPNIIVKGADEEWEEDYWAEIEIGGVKIHTMHNCARCQSLNVDYSTGKFGTGESGKILAKLQKGRRVDPGMKYSPVFGRYSFLDPESTGKTLTLGDEVKILRRNSERTVFDWQGMATT